MAKSKEKPKDPAAQALVAKRHAKLSPDRRREIARQAAEARWGKDRGDKST
ncbi:MAG: hypothetical protein ACK5AZ_24855 [Bryobacteraceae bacterium]